MKRNIIYLFTAVTLILTNASCKKDDAGSGVKAVFSYVADGFSVNFTNFSTNATEYRWDFGDGSGATSSTKTPQHIFRRKGDFLVSLVAKNGMDSSSFKDTVTIIGPNIKIDGDYTDWQYVDYSHVNAATASGTLLAVKTFASSQLISFYLEGTADMKMELFDMYIDADNNPATGFSTFLYPAGSGADFLCEGPPDGSGALYAHSGPPAGFSFSPVATFAEVMNFSKINTVDGKKVIEFSIKRSALGTTRNFINFSFIELTSGYADIGKIPEAQKPGSKFSPIPL